jgi:prepilin-type N-terminal cleavage/methylation domain-containing protein
MICRTPKEDVNRVKTPRSKAFSLVEMLVVVAVIGIISAISISQIGRLNDSAKDAQYRRNAQAIASVFSAAQAAGLDFYVPGDKNSTVTAVVAGGTVTAEGPFKNAFFGVPGLNVVDQASASVFLEMDDATSTIFYKAL